MRVATKTLSLPEKCIINVDGAEMFPDWYAINTITGETSSEYKEEHEKYPIYTINIYRCGNSNNKYYTFACDLMRQVYGDYEAEYCYRPPTRTNHIKDLIESQQAVLNDLYKLYDKISDETCDE